MDLIELSYEIEGSAPVLGGSVAFRKWRNDVCDYLAANAVRLKEFKAISFFPSAGIGDMIQTDWNDGAWDHARKCILDFGSANDEVDIKTNGGSK